jgi:hypothetical protein
VILVRPVNFLVGAISCGAVLAASLVSPSLAYAHNVAWDESEYLAKQNRKLSVGIGAAIERFDTNFKFTEKSTGLSAFVDAEGTLGLPEFAVSPLLYGYWRPGKRHGLGFSYFQVNRTANLLSINENFGDLNVTGNISLSDRTRFYYLSYNLTAFQDDRALVMASFGVYGLDLRYRLDANGAISFRGVPLVSDTYRNEVRQAAPLPMIGVDTWFALTPGWAIGAKASVVGGKYKNISGGVFEARMRAKYAFTKNVGLAFGFNYFQSKIDIDDDDFKVEVNYGFTGLFAGIDVGF